MTLQIRYTILFVLLLNVLYAQPPGNDCASAMPLCPGNTVHYNNMGATVELCPAGCADGTIAVGALCTEVNNTVWYSFTTNTVGGTATMTFSNLNCLTGGGRDNELEFTVLSATTPCNPATYAIITCGGPFSVTTGAILTTLAPNTTYYVVVDGDDVGSGITAPAECEFDVDISGPAVDAQINLAVTNATCAGNDGQVTVTSVTGVTPLNYALNGSPFQTSPTFTNLAAGDYLVLVTSASGCAYSEEFTIGLTGGPQDGVPAVVGSNCGTTNGQIAINGVTGGTGTYTYALNGGAPQASNTFNSLNPGLYDVTVTDNAGCSFTYENISVPVNGSITSAVFNIVQPTCDNPSGTITVIPVGGATPYNYSLNGGPPVSSNVFTGLAPGTYIVLIFDNGGCVYADNQIIIEPVQQTAVAQISISPQTVSVCQGEQVTFNASYTNGGTAPLLQWQVNGANVGANSPVFTSALNNGDVVTCILTSNDPCVTSTTVTSAPVTVTVINQVNPVIAIIPSATQVCVGQSITYTAQVTGCTAGGTYYWFVNGALADSTSGDTYVRPMTTDAEVICTFQCSAPCANPASSNSLNITVIQVFADAGPNLQIGRGESTTLQGDGNGTPVWVPTGTIDNPVSYTPTAFPEETTTYVLTVTNNGCVAIDEVTVVVTDLVVIPNTFTPNGDGINDLWVINRIENFPACKVTVYDRWGQKVFNSTGYTNENAWTGQYLGRELPTAAYYYVIELNSGRGDDTFMGWVSLIY